MKLSIIIVHYNVAHLLGKCISSLIKYVQGIDYEIIVVDNNSPDSSWEQLKTQFSRVQFVASEENLGFAVANNKGAAMASGEYILLLNPDTEFEGFYMKEILDFADSKANFGCLGVRMHDASGSFLPESKRSVPDMMNSFEKLFTTFQKNDAKSYYRNDVSEFDVAEVEVVTGAFLLIKKDLYLKIGGLDEKYFMYGEDIDLCFTLLRENYINWYYGRASILHHKGESTVKDFLYLERFYGAMQIFVEKYYKKQKPLQYLVLVVGLRLRHGLERMKYMKKEI